MRRFILGLGFVLVLLSCMPSGGAGTPYRTSSYGEALAATAAVVAATGVRRASTGDCWASCSRGYVCARDQGLCVPGECSPSCAADEVCQRLSVGLACVPLAGFSRTWPTVGQRSPAAGQSPGSSAAPRSIQGSAASPPVWSTSAQQGSAGAAAE